MENKILRENFKIYDIRASKADIKIYKDNIEKPIVKHNGNFIVFQAQTTAIIEQLLPPRPVKTYLQKNNLELILPNSQNNEKIIIYLSYGDINLKKLILDKLIINHNNGNINLIDIDSLDTKIGLIEGDIIAEINNSILNYITQTNGCCEQSTSETLNTNNIPFFSNYKHQLNITNKEGDIKILFKGKR